jgi:hypothetical protein
MSLTPKSKDRKKFDIDLAYGKVNLKKILDSLERKVSVNGGDHNASRMYLISLQKLFDVKTIKEYISL